MLKNLSPSTRGFIAGLFVMAIVALGYTSISGGGTETPDAAETATTQAESTITRPVDQDATDDQLSDDTDPAPAVRYSDLPPISPTELPDEALDTLDLIGTGGPYPFRQDDGVFQNREGILPDQDRGYYREYTVITPRSDDRGARRIVAGEGGDLYYTSDHYDSFKEIVW